MRETPGDYDEEVEPTLNTTPEKSEKREIMDSFLLRLKEMTAELQRKTRAERPRSPKEGDVFEGIPTEKLEEQARERKEKTAETIWTTIREEGFNRRNLNDLLRNMEVLSLPELQEMMTTIDDLIREWDPTMQWFLQDMKKELEAMARLKEQIE